VPPKKGLNCKLLNALYCTTFKKIFQPTRHLLYPAHAAK
jgi:hypothetical protein